MDKFRLMMLADEQDCESFEEQDLQEQPVDKDQQYKDFYDDIKHPSNYIKEDW
jgi:hypothetical protein